jgi:hypothetical protein
VPQTNLVEELREDSAPAVEDDLEDFTAERAASSLAGFQRGTFRARDEPEGPEDEDKPEDDDRPEDEHKREDEDEHTPYDEQAPHDEQAPYDEQAPHGEDVPAVPESASPDPAGIPTSHTDRS